MSTTTPFSKTYIVINFGDNDFGRAAKLAAQSICEGGWGSGEPPSVDDIVNWFNVFWRAAATLENNRIDMMRWGKDRLVKDYSSYEYLTIEDKDVEFTDTPDTRPKYGNSEVVIIHTELLTVEIY